MPDVEVRQPEPTRASKGRIYAFAEEVARAVGFRAGEALEPIVTRLGGSISYQKLFAEAAGTPPSIMVERQDLFTILLPTTTSPRRNKFTVAHELGHLFLHFPVVQRLHPGAHMVATRWVDARDEVQRRAEWEANWFAASFLMPVDLFRARAAAHCSAAALADEFDVSEQAASIHAQTLGVTIG